MVNVEKLKDAVDRNGFKYKKIAEWMEVNPNTITKKFDGRIEFTAKEIVRLSEILHLTKEERDEIFLQ